MPVSIVSNPQTTDLIDYSSLEESLKKPEHKSYDNPPNEFLDCSTTSIMIDPVILSNPDAAQGRRCSHTFDRLPITKWLRQSQNRSEIKCPLCKQKVTTVVPNQKLAQKIDEWVKDNHFQTQFNADKITQNQEYREYKDKDVIPRQEEIQRDTSLMDELPMFLELPNLLTFLFNPIVTLNNIINLINHGLLRQATDEVRNLQSLIDRDIAYTLIAKAYLRLDIVKEADSLLSRIACRTSHTYRTLEETIIDKLFEKREYSLAFNRILSIIEVDRSYFHLFLGILKTIINLIIDSSFYLYTKTLELIEIIILKLKLLSKKNN
ncbi:MAG: hypothetical protein K1060chlam5_00860 [Candidatus Anoxychlamydiales bacterium]|nr:hypothetical protein [Candidatus Anoxychlamydiales bacterium]